MNESALQALAEGSNGDIRLILGQLQLIRLRSRTLSYDQAKARAAGPGCRQAAPAPCGPRLAGQRVAQLHSGILERFFLA